VKRSTSHLVLVGAAATLLVVGTVVQGRWTERWTPISRDAVVHAADLLEDVFPE